MQSNIGKATIMVTQLTNVSLQITINVINNRNIGGSYLGSKGLLDVFWTKYRVSDSRRTLI